MKRLFIHGLHEPADTTKLENVTIAEVFRGAIDVNGKGMREGRKYAESINVQWGKSKLKK